MAGPVPDEIVVTIVVFKYFTALDIIGPYDALKLVPNVTAFTPQTRWRHAADQALKATTHYTASEELRKLGADVDEFPDRVIFQGKTATAGGVSSGIDFGIQLQSRLAGELTAKVATPTRDYNSEPPYDTGSIERADANSVDLGNKVFADSGVRYRHRCPHGNK